MRFSSRCWVFASAVLLAIALAPDDAGACQPYCEPDEPTHVDPDVPTDVGLKLSYDRCKYGNDRLSDGEVLDASGAVVRGSFQSSNGTWRPAEPLVSGAAYTLREVTLAKEKRSFPFVAGSGPAPLVAPADLDLAATVEAFQGTSACCRGEAVCNYDARCVSVTTAQTWRVAVTIGGQSPRWFQETRALDEGQVGKPKPKDPPPVLPLEAGELCLRVSVITAGAEPVSRPVCLTLGELPAPPDRCGEIVPLYDACDTPDASLTQLAKACGAADKDGCAVHPGRGERRSTQGAAIAMLGAAAAFWLRRVQGSRGRKSSSAPW